MSGSPFYHHDMPLLGKPPLSNRTGWMLISSWNDPYNA
jgi:hypothetical protein